MLQVARKVAIQHTKESNFIFDMLRIAIYIIIAMIFAISKLLIFDRLFGPKVVILGRTCVAQLGPFSFARNVPTVDLPSIY